MIELAHGHKSGLTLPNPIVLGVGVVGHGEATPRGLDLARVGAVVVGPILQSSRAGAAPPRVAETNSGLVVQTGLQNRGIRAVVQRFAPLWVRVGCPVIAHVADNRPPAVRAIMEQLAEVNGLAGMELALPRQADARATAALVGEAVAATELPVCVKLPLERAEVLAWPAADAGAACLVVGQPPLGTLHRPQVPSFVGIRARAAVDGAGRSAVRGEVFGPLTLPLALRALEAVANLNLACGLAACGGIHTWEHVEQALAAGARAVQVDSAVWVEPGVPGRLVAAWEARQALEQR
jgi:dihydroorotate dehydrogenase (NAD+) catalytic subunit